MEQGWCESLSCVGRPGGRGEVVVGGSGGASAGSPGSTGWVLWILQLGPRVPKLGPRVSKRSLAARGPNG